MCVSDVTQNVTVLTVFFPLFVSANQEHGFSINGTLTVNNQKVRKIIK